jgi:hypothetical protein
MIEEERPITLLQEYQKGNEKEESLMVGKPVPEGEWEPLKKRQEEVPFDTIDAREEDLAKPSPELIPEGEWGPLKERQEETPFEAIDVKEEDLAKFSPEMIQDSQENYTDEQRSNLYQKIQELNASEKFRLAIFANREVRNLLIHDPKKMVSLAVLRNGRVDESEALHYAQRKDLSEDVILAIAKEQKWKKSYPIKFAVISNPKTPLSVAMSLLSHLHERDLKSLSHDKDVSSIVRRKAQEILHKRRGRSDK